MKECLLIGFGRMGMSHALLMNAVCRNRINFTIIDTNLINRIIAKIMFPSANVQSQLNIHANYYHFCILSVPPNKQFDIYGNIIKHVGKVLVEKPIRVDLRREDQPGYVMVHNPILTKLKDLIKNDSVSMIEVSLQSNIDFNCELGGWRKGYDGTIKSEFFSHAASIVLSLLVDDTNVDVDCGCLEILTDDNNIFESAIVFNGKVIKLNLYGAKDVRKTNYYLNCTCADVTYSSDLFTITKNMIGKDIMEVVNITQLRENNFYLRGFEFTKQMIYFLENNKCEKNLFMINNIIQNWEKVIEKNSR